MVRKKIPDYLLRMRDDYLSDTWVIYEGDMWSLIEEMTYHGQEILQIPEYCIRGTWNYVEKEH